jgi:predicted phosphodiesterase
MVARKIDDGEILEAWKNDPSPTRIAKKYGMAIRTLHNRVRQLRANGHHLPGTDIRSPYFEGEIHRHREEYSPRLATRVDDGCILIGSDAHYIPGVRTTAQRAFEKLCKEMKPKVVVMNGDLFDGAAVSRWPRIGWEQRPTVKQELAAVDENLTAIEKAVPGAAKIWCLGNHDARYELRLAQAAPEYEGVAGFTLKEHFPLWRPCWSIWINDSTVIKHRFKSGVHAAYNGTVHAGKTLIHGHLHSLKVYPFTDYNGTRYGVDAGTMAEPYGGAFEGYMEDSPRSWRSGFVVLTYHKGRLLCPEMALVCGENEIEFRGKVISL